MKLWIKYLIGIVLGFLLALILPAHSATTETIVANITDFIIRLGRYCVVPLLFFSAVTAVNKLRTSKMLGKTVSWSFLIIIVSTLLLICVALISVLLIRLPRIPITAERAETIQTIDFKNLVHSLFPFSAFESLTNGSFLLSPFLLAVLVGVASASDTAMFKSIITLFDSLSKLFYNIATFFMEMLAIGMIAVMTNWTIQSRTILTTGTFTPLIIMLLVNFIIIAFGLYPLILRYICSDVNPYRILYASACSTLVAFFSGDSALVFPINIRTGKESLGIRRGINGITYPLFSIFARGGSAFICVISFVAIWRSYAYMSIPVSNVLWVCFMSFCLSFVLGGFPTGGAFVALTVLCTLYGRGFETSFLLLKPAAPIICSFATAIDTLTAMFGSYIVGVKTQMTEHHSIYHFV